MQIQTIEDNSIQILFEFYLIFTILLKIYNLQVFMNYKSRVSFLFIFVLFVCWREEK